MNYLRTFRLLTKTAFKNLKRDNTDYTKILNNFCCNSFMSTNLLRRQTSGLIDDETLKKLSIKISDVEKKVKMITLEIESLRLEGFDVPESIVEKNWFKILEEPNFFKRRNMYLYLAQLKSRNDDKVKKIINYETNLKNINLPNHLEYRIGKNAIMLRISQTQIKNLLNCKLYAAELFSNDIVIDMDYERFMNDHHLKDCAREVLSMFLENRRRECPFNIHLCNYPKDSKLSDYINTALKDDIHNLPINVHEKSYTDIFDKDRLVYLSPDAKSYLKEYDPNAVYVIGGFVDLGRTIPISLSKAKVNNIKVVKFPIDEYLDWKHGSKSLPFSVALSVMSDLQYYRDWNMAFKNILKRAPGDDARKFEFRNKSMQYKLQPEVCSTTQIEQNGRSGNLESVFNV